MLQACLFDLDGVLVDTARHHFTAWQRLAQERIGVTFTHYDNEQLKGLSRLESLNYILSKTDQSFSDEAMQEMMQVKNDWYLELVAQLTPEDALPGATDLLHALKDAGIKTGLGSASKNAPLIIEKLGIAHLLDVVIDGNVVSKSKPDPEVFLKGADALNVSPANTIVFEDALSGVSAAKSGGFFCVGIGLPEDLLQADFVVRDLSQIKIELLNKTFFSH